MATKLKVNYEFVGDSTTPVTRTNSIKHGDKMLNNVIDNMSTYVTPEMFGAKGDASISERYNDSVIYGNYSGTDDTTAIQNAINYAHSNNLYVVFPNKCYLISSTLNIPNASTLVGTGMGSTWGDSSTLYRTTTIVKSNDNGAIFDFGQKNQSSIISNITLTYTMNVFNDYSKNTIGIKYGNGSHLKLENVMIGKCSKGIYINSLWGSSWDSVHFNDCGYGVYFNDECTSIQGNNITFLDTPFAFYGNSSVQYSNFKGFIEGVTHSNINNLRIANNLYPIAIYMNNASGTVFEFGMENYDFCHYYGTWGKLIFNIPRNRAFKKYNDRTANLSVEKQHPLMVGFSVDMSGSFIDFSACSESSDASVLGFINDISRLSANGCTISLSDKAIFYPDYINTSRIMLNNCNVDTSALNNVQATPLHNASFIGGSVLPLSNNTAIISFNTQPTTIGEPYDVELPIHVKAFFCATAFVTDPNGTYAKVTNCYTDETGFIKRVRIKTDSEYGVVLFAIGVVRNNE